MAVPLTVVLLDPSSLSKMRVALWWRQPARYSQQKCTASHRSRQYYARCGMYTGQKRTTVLPWSFVIGPESLTTPTIMSVA